MYVFQLHTNLGKDEVVSSCRRFLAHTDAKKTIEFAEAISVKKHYEGQDLQETDIFSLPRFIKRLIKAE